MFQKRTQMMMPMNLEKITNGMTTIDFIPCPNKDEDAFHDKFVTF